MITKDWAVLPYNVNKIKDHYVVATLWGNWVALNAPEFKRLNQLSLDGSLLNKLKKNGILVFSTNHPFRPNYPYSEWTVGKINNKEITKETFFKK